MTTADSVFSNPWGVSFFPQILAFRNRRFTCATSAQARVISLVSVDLLIDRFTPENFFKILTKKCLGARTWHTLPLSGMSTRELTFYLFCVM